MSDSTTLKYVAADLEDMHEPDTCTVRRCRRADGSRLSGTLNYLDQPANTGTADVSSPNRRGV